MPPLPPRSPLFPYTTLFRSALVLAVLVVDQDHHAPETEVGERVIDAGELHVLPSLHGAARDLPCRRRSRRPPSDRKSTRLNSSHTVISYAVFCLKKKKKERM